MKGGAGAFDLFQDICGFGGLGERFGIFIVMVDIIADCQDQFLDVSKDAAAQPILSQVAEESLAWDNFFKTPTKSSSGVPWESL